MVVARKRGAQIAKGMCDKEMTTEVMAEVGFRGELRDSIRKK